MTNNLLGIAYMMLAILRAQAAHITMRIGKLLEQEVVELNLGKWESISWESAGRVQALPRVWQKQTV